MKISSALMMMCLLFSSACTPGLNRQSFLKMAASAQVSINQVPTIVRGGSIVNFTFNLLTGNSTLTSAIFDYSLDGGKTYLNPQNISPNSATFAWTVPTVDVTTAKVRITVTDMNQKVVVQSSNLFAIDSTPPVPLVISLNSATPTNVATATVTISDCNDHALVLLNTGATPTLSSSGWITCSQAAGALPYLMTSEGSWNLVAWAQDEVGNISLASNTVTTIYDITPPANLAITSPVGGEYWQGGSLHAITWTPATDLNLAASPIDLLYSSDDGVTWTTIATAIANTGTYNWNVPSLDSDSMKVKIVAHDLAGNSSSSISAADFSIDSTSPVVTLTSATGGNYISGGSTYNITWTAVDANFGATPINLLVSNNGGATYSALASNLANSGSYSWTVPAVDASNYRIQVQATDLSGHVVTDQSASNFTIDNTNPAVSLTSLTGGQYVQGGTNVAITWTASDTNFGATPISILSSTDSGATWTSVASNLANSGSYTWSVPAVDVDHYRIKVTATDKVSRVSSSASATDFVVASTIPSMSLTYPVGGEMLAGGSVHNITWTASATHLSATPIDLYYSNNDGTTWNSLAPGIANTGTYAWTVPSVDSSHYRIKAVITDLSGNTNSASSPASFTIDSTSPVITLNSPVGGEYMAGASTFNITWTASDTNFGATPITLEYSNNAGATWTNIASNLANSGTYAWTVPSVNSNQYRIRATAVDLVGHSTQSASPANFTIDSTTPTISLNSFNGCTVYTGGSTQNITWTAADTNFGATPIQIQLSTDSGTTWNNLGAAQSNSGTYSWTLPAASSVQNQIRVTATDLVSKSATAASTYNFAINTYQTLVMGQADYVSSSANRGSFLSDNTLNRPFGIDTTGSTVYVADSLNNRVLVFNSFCQLFKDEHAAYVLGQTAFGNSTANAGGLSASTLSQPTGVSTDGTHLCVADKANHRVLLWNSLPASSAQAADVVLGQPNMTSNTANNGGLSASTLNTPYSCLLRSGKLYVADTSNNRVLIWNSVPTVNGTAANVVVGQANFTSNANTVSSTGLSGPRAMEVVSGKLLIADTDSNRVLIYTSVPAANGAAANYVIGQPDFISFLRSTTDGTTVTPAGIATDGTRIAISDGTNARVMVWATVPASNGQAASSIIGQPDATSTTSNNGGISQTSIASDVLGLSVVNGYLWISDGGNHRIISDRW